MCAQAASRARFKQNHLGNALIILAMQADPAFLGTWHNSAMLLLVSGTENQLCNEGRCCIFPDRLTLQGFNLSIFTVGIIQISYTLCHVLQA